MSKGHYRHNIIEC